jgi:hypothetical protein
VLVHPFALSADARLSQSRAVTLQAQTLGVGLLADDIKPLAAVAAHADNAEREGIELLSVLLLAARLGCQRVVWPVSAGEGEAIDIDRLSNITDRALVASKLASLCSVARVAMGISLETPLVDLTDSQLAELALDADAPLDTVWWWHAKSPEEARERTRWKRTLDAAGYAAV